VVATLACFAALLLAAGLGLFGLGVGMSVEGELGGGLLSVVVGLLTLYGAYLFGRASRRLRAARDLAPRQGLGAGTVGVAVTSVAVGSALALVAPIPGAEKVVCIVIAALGAVVALAAIAEPAKSRDPR
jgi:hypothetical protein